MIAPLQRQVHVHMHVNDTTTEGCDVTATDAEPDTLHGDTATPEQETSTCAEDTQRWLSRMSNRWSDLFDVARAIKLDMAGTQLPTVLAPNGETEDLNRAVAVDHDETIAFLDWVLERAGYFAHGFGLHESRMQTLAARPRRLRT